MGFGHDLGPKPNDAVEAALWTFASFSNWGNLHPDDDRRFWDFIAVAAAEKSQWRATDVENRLLGYGLPKELAHKLGQRFWDRMKPVEDKEVRKLNTRLGQQEGKT
jgi:CO/xanthine dehydrogenase FAD-binding subunit